MGPLDFTRNNAGQAYEVLSLFAHELSQPLTAAIGAASVIEVSPDPDKQKLGHEIVVRNLKQLQALLENIKMFANLDSGDVPVTRSEVDLVDLCSEAVEDFGDQSGSRTVALHCPDGIRVNVDVVLLKQVLFNLLTNAVKFSPKESTISLTARRNDGHAMLSVHNDGEGFPTGEGGRIFERAVRLEPNQQGMGVGLYVTRAIVQAHQGRIWAESEPGKGAAFYVTVPL